MMWKARIKFEEKYMTVFAKADTRSRAMEVVRCNFGKTSLISIQEYKPTMKSDEPERIQTRRQAS